ncbi:MAG: hypothetical protein HGA85_09195 [Nanoarchaeota archaeon]|nr:hypothetical protein [Nanoarchaeota archaeon]
MVTGRLELEIIDLFERDISQVFSINEIAKTLGKSYPSVNLKVSSLIDEEVITKNQVGRSYLCHVNLKNQKTIALLSLIQSSKLHESKLKTLEPEVQKLLEVFDIYTVFHCKERLYFVLGHIYDQEAIKKYSRRIAKEKTVFYTKEEFCRAVLAEQAILTEKTILYSASKYYEFVDRIVSEIRRRRLRL